MRLKLDPDRPPPIVDPPVAAETGNPAAPAAPLPGGSGEAPAHWLEVAQSAGPPAHWVEKVRAAAPHLLPLEWQAAAPPAPEAELPAPSEAEVQPPLLPVEPAAFAPVRQPLDAPAATFAAPAPDPARPQEAALAAPRTDPRATAPVTPTQRQESASAPVRASSTAAASDGTFAPAPAPDRSAFPSPPRTLVRAARFQQLAPAAPPVHPPLALVAPALPPLAPARAATTPAADAQNVVTGQSTLAAPGPSTQLAAPPARPPDTPHVTAPLVAEAAPPLKLETIPPAAAFAPVQATSRAGAPLPQSPVSAVAAGNPPAAPVTVRQRPAPQPRYAAANPPTANPLAPTVESWQLVRTARPTAAPQPTVAPQPWPALLEATAPEEPSLETVLRAQARRQRLDREQRGDAWNA